MTLWVPHDYQKTAIDFLSNQDFAGLLLDPGLGKTSISLEVICQQQLRPLVLSPLRVTYSTWPREIEKWDNFKNLKYGILHGPQKEKVLYGGDCDVYLMNYDGLPWLVQHLDTMRKAAFPFTALLCDESSKLKRTKTSRYRIMKHIYNRFERRYILTGSPAANGLLGIFPQALIMDGGLSLGKYITRFREKYFYRAGFKGYSWKLQKGADEEIFKAIAPRMLRMAARDYLKLPPLIKRVVPIPISEKVKQIHKEMRKKLVAEIEAGKITAANAGIASMKCRQIANGGLLTGKDTWEHLHYEKANAVLDLVEELEGQPALVAFEFRHDLDRLLKVLGKDTPYIDGGTPIKKYLEIEKRWNKGEIPVLLAHPSPVAYGLNLQEAGRAIIWHSLTPNLEWYEQFISRIWRQGVDRRVFVYHLIAEGTIDEVVYKSLRVKARNQGNLYEALQEYWLGDPEVV